MEELRADLQTESPIQCLQVVDHKELRSMWMPFIQQGGLFLPCDSRGYSLGESFFAFLQLPDQPDRLAVHGRIIWITPPSRHRQRSMGVGIQFPVGGCTARQIIEDLLASSRADGGELSGYTL